MTTQDTIQAFTRQEARACHDGCGGHNSTHSLYWRDRILYSYGSHYPLAILINDNIAVINGSGYSVTTGKHTSWARWELDKAGYTVYEAPTKAMQSLAYWILYANDDGLESFIRQARDWQANTALQAEDKLGRARAEHMRTHWKREQHYWQHQADTIAQVCRQ